jgi:hypothetical protein
MNYEEEDDDQLQLQKLQEKTLTAAIIIQRNFRSEVCSLSSPS